MMCSRLGSRTVTGLTLALALAVRPPADQLQSSPPAVPQQPPISFKSEVEYVEVYAIVTDSEGRFVTDLTSDSFEIVEDNTRQTISTFALVDLSISERAAQVLVSPPIEADVAANESDLDGRVFVLVLDDLHTSASRTEQVKKSARQFVERYVGPTDQVAVVHTSGREGGAQDFTRSARRLVAAIDGFDGQKNLSAARERLDEYHRQLSRGAVRPQLGNERVIDDTHDADRGQDARAAMLTIARAAQRLAGVSGRRKSIVLISEGLDYDIYDPFSGRQASAIMTELREAIGAATRANVSIYAIDPRGATGVYGFSVTLPKWWTRYVRHGPDLSS